MTIPTSPSPCKSGAISALPACLTPFKFTVSWRAALGELIECCRNLTQREADRSYCWIIFIHSFIATLYFLYINNMDPNRIPYPDH